jgi:uncharacterized protein YndB with AHSA1/START domain
VADDVSVTRDIGASPERVWAMVSDLARMGEWSSENVGGEWIGGATGPEPGARFRGANQNGTKRWNSVVTVADADPGRRFSFRVTAFGIKISDWGYDFESTPTGCRVTETWTDLRPGWFKPLSRVATGVAERQSHTRAGVELTLERLGAAAEAES